MPTLPDLVTSCALCLFAAGVHAQTPWYPTQPHWQSQAGGKYATGLGVADINGDDRPDLVVANGNDMRRQRLEVYYGSPTGYATTPDWESGDLDYLGHLAVGDINGDGRPDVAVSVFLGPNRFNSKGHAKVYLNNQGTLSSTPSWRTQDSFFSFGLALGDADADGDLDLLVATGEGYYNPPDVNRLYLNNQGTLAVTPSWQSTVQDHAMGALFADVDNDGHLDLVFAAWNHPSTVYYNRGGGIFPTTPDWQTADNSTSIMAAAGDLDGDGLPELLFADNSQTGGQGRLKFYRNSPQGPATTATWVSAPITYGSCLALADLDHDDAPDLVGGGWWAPVVAYRNLQGTFGTTPDWTSSTSSVLEKIVLRDTALQGLYLHTEAFAGDGLRRVFTLRRFPVERVHRVWADGVLLPGDRWCADPCTGWVSLATAPVTNLKVETIASHNPDLIATNWDTSKGNYLFRRQVSVRWDWSWLFPWYDPGLGMWPFIGRVVTGGPALPGCTIEATCYDQNLQPLHRLTIPRPLVPSQAELFWGWFPFDPTLSPGLLTIRLRCLDGTRTLAIREHNLELSPPKPILR